MFIMSWFRVWDVLSRWEWEMMSLCCSYCIMRSNQNLEGLLGMPLYMPFKSSPIQPTTRTPHPTDHRRPPHPFLPTTLPSPLNSNTPTHAPHSQAATQPSA